MMDFLVMIVAERAAKFMIAPTQFRFFFVVENYWRPGAIWNATALGHDSNVKPSFCGRWIGLIFVWVHAVMLWGFVPHAKPVLFGALLVGA